MSGIITGICKAEPINGLTVLYNKAEDKTSLYSVKDDVWLMLAEVNGCDFNHPVITRGIEKANKEKGGNE